MKSRLPFRRRAACGLLFSLIAWCGGCATSSDSASGAASAVSGGPKEGAREFYRDWFDATAVVLPPPGP